MRIALYIGGRSKLYDKWLINQIKESNDEIDVFASLNEEYNEKFINVIKPLRVNWENYILPEKYLSVSFTHESTKPKNMCSMFYNNKRAFEMIETYSKENSVNYDIVVKFRPDIAVNTFPSFINPENNTVYTPDHGIFGWPGLNDQIAYGDFNSMKIYSAAYDYIDEYISKGVMFHPETMLRYHLDFNNIKIKEIDYKYELDIQRN